MDLWSYSPRAVLRRQCVQRIKNAFHTINSVVRTAGSPSNIVDSIRRVNIIFPGDATDEVLYCKVRRLRNRSRSIFKTLNFNFNFKTE